MRRIKKERSFFEVSSNIPAEMMIPIGLLTQYRAKEYVKDIKVIGRTLDLSRIEHAKKYITEEFIPSMLGKEADINYPVGPEEREKFDLEATNIADTSPAKSVILTIAADRLLQLKQVSHEPYKYGPGIIKRDDGWYDVILNVTGKTTIEQYLDTFNEIYGNTFSKLLAGYSSESQTQRNLDELTGLMEYMRDNIETTQSLKLKKGGTQSALIWIDHAGIAHAEAVEPADWGKASKPLKDEGYYVLPRSLDKRDRPKYLVGRANILMKGFRVRAQQTLPKERRIKQN